MSLIRSENFKERLTTSLTQIRGQKILVIGDIGVDRYTMGIVERVSPEAPVPIVSVQEEKLKLGLAANVADNIHALGGVPFLIGVLGQDRCAGDFRALLDSTGIQSSFLVEDPSRRTVLKERVVSDRQQLVRIDYENLHPIGKAVEMKILEKAQELISQVDGIILEDYAKGVLNQDLAQAIIRLANENQKVIAVDPNLRTPVSYYCGATLLTPNTREAEQLSGIVIRSEADLKQAGFALLQMTSARHVVITRGKDGMAIFHEGSEDVHFIPTYAKEVYDVSGAGDTVISVLVLCLASGIPIEVASTLGNVAAGIVVGKRGTATVSPQEIESVLEAAEE